MFDFRENFEPGRSDRIQITFRNTDPLPQPCIKPISSQVHFLAINIVTFQGPDTSSGVEAWYLYEMVTQK